MVYLGSWGGGALEPHYWACSPFKIIESGWSNYCRDSYKLSWVWVSLPGR
jgi:hypothetical protein